MKLRHLIFVALVFGYIGQFSAVNALEGRDVEIAKLPIEIVEIEKVFQDKTLSLDLTIDGRLESNVAGNMVGFFAGDITGVHRPLDFFTELKLLSGEKIIGRGEWIVQVDVSDDTSMVTVFSQGFEKNSGNGSGDGFTSFRVYKRQENDNAWKIIHFAHLRDNN